MSDDASTPLGDWPGHERGSRAYRRILLGLFCAGVATFAQLYSFQAVLPEVASGLRVTAAQSALTVSAATLGLAAAVVPWSSIADRIGRVPAMVASVCGATAMGFLGSTLGDLGWIVGARFLEGCALGGVPAIAIAYLNEEVHRAHAARASAIYVAGTSIGGLSGRLIAAPVAELTGSWRIGVLAVMIVCVAAVAVFASIIPPSRGFVPLGRRPPGMLPHSTVVQRTFAHLRNPRITVLFLHGFLLMGSFVAVYNYLGFRLGAPPYSLPVSVVSLLFLAYLGGTAASAAAGGLTERVGRHAVLMGSTGLMAAGAVLTLAEPLWLIVVGLLLITGGFFAGHAVASGWVGAIAVHGRAQAGSLYNLLYYAGSSLLGWFGGVMMQWIGWPGVAWMVLGALALALALAAAVLPRGEG